MLASVEVTGACSSATGSWRELPALCDESGDEEFVLSLIGASICLAYLIAVNFLFLRPLASHESWVEINGIFSNKPRSAKTAIGASEMDIIKGEKLKQYSVADELLKWAKLKEEGHISEDQFNEARSKLLKRS